MATEEARGDGNRAAWLGHQPCLQGKTAHRRADLVLGDRHHVVHVAQHVPQRKLADLLHPQRVGHGALGIGGRPRHPLPLAQRVTGIGGEFRLHADDLGGRAQRPDRRGDARDQAAAADRAQHEIRVRAVGGDLQADGSLPRDHRPVVERRDDRVAVPRDQLAGRREPRGQARLRDDHLGAERPGGSDLDGWRVGRDDNGRRDLEQRGRIGNGLRVIAAGMRHDPAAPRLGGQRGDRRIGAAQLERAGRLERFRLQQQPRLYPGEGYEGRPQRHAAEAGRGRADLIDRNEFLHLSHPRAVHRALCSSGAVPAQAHPVDVRAHAPFAKFPRSDFPETREKTHVCRDT